MTEITHSLGSLYKLSSIFMHFICQVVKTNIHCYLLGDMQTLFENGCGFPDEIMMEIMSLVEAVDLYGLRTVSKNWYASINDKNFITLHTKVSSCRRVKHLVTCKVVPDPVSPIYSLFFTQSTKYVEEEKWCLLSIHNHFPPGCVIELVGTTDGLICLEYSNGTRQRAFVICNPVTGQNYHIKMPETISNECKLLLMTCLFRITNR